MDHEVEHERNTERGSPAWLKAMHDRAEAQLRARLGPHKPPFPEVLSPGLWPSPEHIQALWAKATRKRPLPSIGECSNILSRLMLASSVPGGRTNRRRPPSPIADAMATLQARIPEAVSFWQNEQRQSPSQRSTAPHVLARIEQLRAALHMLTADWLLEPQIVSVKLVWERTVLFLYEVALEAWVRTGHKPGKPHAKDSLCLFLYYMLQAVNMGQGKPGGCKSPGAISEFLRASFKNRIMRPQAHMLAFIEFSNRRRAELEDAWRNHPENSEILPGASLSDP